jgi:hypothetical protein
VLDAELWIAPDDDAARCLEQELAREGKTLPVLTADEALVFAGMSEQTARDVFRAIAVIKVNTGGRLLSFACREDA